MNNLYIPSSLNTPEVQFESEDLTFTFKGDSIIDANDKFYQNLEDFVNSLEQSKPLQLKFNFHFEKFCNNSKRKVLFFLQAVKIFAIKNKCRIIIDWYFDPENKQLSNLGENYEYMTGLRFHSIQPKSVSLENTF